MPVRDFTVDFWRVAELLESTKLPLPAKIRGKLNYLSLPGIPTCHSLGNLISETFLSSQPSSLFAILFQQKSRNAKG